MLRAQTEHRLASSKAGRFSQYFVGNKLNTGDIDFGQPDTKRYPELEHYLQPPMVSGTYKIGNTV